MKTAKIMVLICLGAFLASAHADIATPSVQLLRSVQINTMKYRLGDIAQIHTNDAELKNKLEAAEIGITPRMGYTEYVSRRQIEKRIGQLHPDLSTAINWTGNDKVGVRGQGIELDLQPQVNQARDLIALHLRRTNDGLTELEINLVGSAPRIAVPRGAVSVTARVDDNAELNKRLRAWIDVRVEGNHYQTIPIWFSIKAYKPVVVAKRAMPRHQRLQQDDFIVRTQDIAGSRGVLKEISESPVSLWLKRPLARGEILVAEDLEEIPLVRRGENVRVTLVEGPVQIETEGMAQVHGRMGDIVRVQNLQTSGIYAARVTGLAAVTIKGR